MEGMITEEEFLKIEHKHSFWPGTTDNRCSYCHEIIAESDEDTRCYPKYYKMFGTVVVTPYIPLMSIGIFPQPETKDISFVTRYGKIKL